ncbi:MAG: uL14 family ribosomal protein [Candidatus Hodgkinia cicadicola]
MIQVQTIVKVGDNSGVKRIRCIKIMGKNRNYAHTGQLIKAAVVSVESKSKFKRGQIVNAIVIREAKFFSRNSCRIKFNQSAVSLLNATSEPVATRIFGPIPLEFKYWNSRVFNIASNVV